MRTRLSSFQRHLYVRMGDEFAAAEDEHDLGRRCGEHRWSNLTDDVTAGGLGLGEVEAILMAERLGSTGWGVSVLETAPCGDEAARLLRRSAYLIGLGNRAIGLGAAHARNRRQFGAPIGAFQAIGFPLAAHQVRLEGARLRAYEMAAHLDAGRNVRRDVEEFARSVEELAFDAVGHGLHVHGAAGLASAGRIGSCYRLLLGAAREPAATRRGSPGAGGPARNGRDRHRELLRRRVPAGRQGKESVRPGPHCIHKMVTEAARRYPDHPAVQAGRSLLSYGELEESADQLAWELRARGVRTDTTVGVCLPRGTDLIVALLAVLKAGGAYVPLDPDYPPHRLKLMAADSGARVIITRGRKPAWLPGSGSASVLMMDGDRWHERRERYGPPTPEAAGPGTLAYVMYTSGSTGAPKGVEIEHSGVANRLRWDQETFPLGPGDAVLQHTSTCFDISVWEIFAPLVSGARLVLAAPEGGRDPAELVRTVVAEEITALAAVPSLLDVMLDEDPGLAAASRLRYVFSGGEALSPELCRRVFDRLPGAELHNFYGPSEATIDVTSWHCTPESIEEGVPIGRPLTNVRTYVLDDTGDPVPAGEAGELAVGGAGVARGYRNRPEATRDAFVPDPFSAVPGAHLYRTGDLVRHRSDGALEFLGRIDDQVKVAGIRVEPREIETVLERHPAVRQAVVKAVRGVRLEGYVTCFQDRAAPTGPDLTSWLRERLPASMVPAVVHLLPSLPLMPNGKVDRAAVAAPAGGVAADREGGLQEQVARLMAEVLGQGHSIGADGDFFDLGGTSLEAARLVTRLRNRLGLDIGLQDFIEAPTCAAVVRHAADRRGAAEARSRGAPS